MPHPQHDVQNPQLAYPGWDAGAGAQSGHLVAQLSSANGSPAMT
jgi:hypothetical protein